MLPKGKPRYLMGVGFAVDLVVCSALGVDMFDCVFPTRTAVSLCKNLFIKSNTFNNNFVEIWMCTYYDRSVELKAKNVSERFQSDR